MRASLLMLLLAGAPAASELEGVPQGFLEFLGAMVEQDGEWVDPLSLQPVDGKETQQRGDTGSDDDGARNESKDSASEDGDADE
jgi:hypothetical protein